MPLCLVALLMVLPGCLAMRETYEHYPADQVWTAMQAVAESPDYDDWFVIENEVWADPEQARLEIYRVNRRVLHRPRARPLDEKRTWKFQVTLEETDPPIAAFRTRSAAVPGHARLEAESYFDEVWEILGGRRLPPEPVPEPEPIEYEPLVEAELDMEPIEEPAGEDDEAPAADPPPVDVDDVTGG